LDIKRGKHTRSDIQYLDKIGLLSGLGYYIAPANMHAHTWQSRFARTPKRCERKGEPRKQQRGKKKNMITAVNLGGVSVYILNSNKDPKTCFAESIYISIKQYFVRKTREKN
jgi:hypothetical protein